MSARCLAVVLLASFFLPGHLSAQEIRREGFQPVDDRAFDILSQFYAYDRGLALDARVVERHEVDKAVIEKVVFTASNGERVPGYFALPKAAEGRVPLVLLMHGLGSSKDWWWDSQPASRLNRSLLANGIATFAIDMELHGERSAANDFQDPMFLTFENTLYIRNRDMLIQSAIDCRRALDYARSRSEVDTSRVALVGSSMGGMLALEVAALEPWVHAVVGAIVPSHRQLLPADHYHFAARVRAPVLLMTGRTDWHSSPEDAQTLLALIGNDDRKLTLYDSGHRLPDEWAAEALDWLLERLR